MDTICVDQSIDPRICARRLQPTSMVFRHRTTLRWRRFGAPTFNALPPVIWVGKFGWVNLGAPKNGCLEKVEILPWVFVRGCFSSRGVLDVPGASGAWWWYHRWVHTAARWMWVTWPGQRGAAIAASVVSSAAFWGMDWNWSQPIDDCLLGWWFGTWLSFFHILRMSSSQLTFIFFRGVGYTTNQLHYLIACFTQPYLGQSARTSMGCMWMGKAAGKQLGVS